MKFIVTVRKEGMPDQMRTIEASSRFSVYDQMQKEGNVVMNIAEDVGSRRLPVWLSHSFGSGVKHREIIRMAKNLSAMLGAGISLSRALSIVERQSSNTRLKAVVTGLSDSIKRGSSFRDALAIYPHVFSSLFVAMVRAGEESGSLSSSLAVVGLQMERSDELIRKIRGAMMYPAIVVVAIITVSILMLLYVVPTLTETFTSLGVEVPFTTRAIVALSDFILTHVVLMLVLLVVLGVGGISFLRSKKGRGAVLTVALHLPTINELVRETYAARASRTLSSLLSSNVPVLEALSITKEVVHVGAFAEVVGDAEVRVKKGELLSASFAEHTELYPILMSEMLTVGEETGKVAEMLRQIAEFYETDVAEKTKDLSAIIEPVLMLLIGTGVGIFAVSMIAPIYSLSSVF